MLPKFILEKENFCIRNFIYTISRKELRPISSNK